MTPIPEICAIIPARGGSKGFPRKNVRLMAGKPLVAHTILAAQGSRYIRDCVLTTEDPEIREIGAGYGAEVVDRPAHLAGDLTTSQEVVRHVLEQLDAEGRRPEYFVLLQPTSPLRTAQHIDACIEEFFRSGASCAISVTVSEHSPFKALVSEGGRLAPLFDAASLHQPRQTLPRTYRQNGAIYLMTSALFLERNTFFVDPAMPFVMPPEASIDIDSPRDLEIAESGYFGQDYYDLITCAASNANTEQDELHRRVLSISARMQAVIDTAGLSDTLLLIARKVSHA